MAAATRADHGLIVTRAAAHQLPSGTEWPWFGAVQYYASTQVLPCRGRRPRVSGPAIMAAWPLPTPIPDDLAPTAAAAPRPAG
jgi:hypothetical protein